MKKYMVLVLCAALMCAPAGCSKKSTTTESGVTISNPVSDSTKEAVEALLGVTIVLPDSDGDPVYSVINTDGDNDMAQIVFKIGGIEYTYRAQKLAELTDISGAYYDWTTDKDVSIRSCCGGVHYIDGKNGYCNWYDAETGVCYCLYMETGADESTLTTMAYQLYPES